MKFLIPLALLLSAPLSHAQVQRYDFYKTRAKLKRLANLPEPKLEVKGEAATPAAKAFLDYFLQEIWPMDVKMQQVILRYRSNSLRKDSGSYLGKLQGKELDAGKLAALSEYNAFLTDETVTQKMAKWAELSQGLSGELPERARRENTSRQLQSFPAAMKPVLEEIALLKKNYDNAIDEADAKAEIQPFTEALTTIQRLFKSNEITLTEARARLRALYAKPAYQRTAEQAVRKTGDTLNRIAVLRTELAKSKGFPTWGAYQLEASGDGYEPEYRGPAKQREFLLTYLKALVPLYLNFIEERKTALGFEGEVYSPEIRLLTLPGVQVLQRYFPPEKLTDIWEKAMLDSGFAPEVLNQILVDDKVRKKKYLTGAYMAGILTPQPPTIQIDAAALKFIYAAKGLAGREPGFAYILQNYEGAGVDDLHTAFHEGGHALDHVLAYQENAMPEAYGYVEVPSMSMERFTLDAEFLHANAVPVDGQKPSLEEIRKITENETTNKIASLVDMARQALFDNQLWDYDYTAPGAQTFLARVEHLHKEVYALTGNFQPLPSETPNYYWWVSTSHFVSGEVRHIGYTFAEIASEAMASFVTEEIERTSGRRSWNRQPGLATIFADQFYNQGWKYLFPTNIEKITGRKFDPASVVEGMAKRLGCEQLLAR